MDEPTGDENGEGPWAAADRAADASALHRPVVVGPEVVSRPAGPGTATVHGFPEPLGVEPQTRVSTEGSGHS